MSALKRDWIANGPKQSSYNAAFDIAMIAESNNGKHGMDSVFLMDDVGKALRKCFIRSVVSHRDGAPPVGQSRPH